MYANKKSFKGFRYMVNAIVVLPQLKKMLFRGWWRHSCMLKSWANESLKNLTRSRKTVVCRSVVDWRMLNLWVTTSTVSLLRDSVASNMTPALYYCRLVFSEKRRLWYAGSGEWQSLLLLLLPISMMPGMRGVIHAQEYNVRCFGMITICRYSLVRFDFFSGEPFFYIVLGE